MLSRQEIEKLYRLMEFEAARTSPPVGFSGASGHSSREIYRSRFFRAGTNTHLAKVLAVCRAY